jgi:hypothetical protein
MLDGRAVGLDACRDMGISMFAGEAEGRLEMLLQDAVTGGRLALLYNFIEALPSIEGTPVGAVPAQTICRAALALSASLDAGRGCPYQCTIINVQVRLNWAQGIHKFFITDDNFARNKEWGSIFDRLIVLRDRG